MRGCKGGQPLLWLWGRSPEARKRRQEWEGWLGEDEGPVEAPWGDAWRPHLLGATTPLAPPMVSQTCSESGRGGRRDLK